VDIEVGVRKSSDSAYIVDIAGEVDIFTSPKVKEALALLIDQQHYCVVVNMSKVRYIDSTGLGVLIGGLKRVREHGGAMNLVLANGQIRKIFDITGLVKIFGIFVEEAAAVRALA